MQALDYSHIVGVFRERPQAEQAIAGLKEAGFSDEQLQLTRYTSDSVLSVDETAVTSSDERVLVQVEAPEREQEAVAILAHCGANNADLPLGMALVHGSLVHSRQAEGM